MIAAWVLLRLMRLAAVVATFVLVLLGWGDPLTSPIGAAAVGTFITWWGLHALVADVARIVTLSAPGPEKASA